MLVEGEAGVGKTTVWAAAIGEAESRGIRVLQARAAETEVQLSYAALADLVGAEFEAARRALPPIQQRALAAALLRAESDELVQPRTIATAFVGVLASIAEAAVVLVAVDDVQWLDPASAEALAFAARRLPAGSACSSPGAAIHSTLCRSASSGRCPRVGWSGWCPGPLSLAALHHLIHDRLGSAPPRPALARLAEASGGNPFLALEIARALGADWSVARRRRPAAGAAGPAGGRERARRRALGARTRGKPGRCGAVPTDARLILRAVASEDDAGAGLLEAEDAGVLATEGERVRFAHPLLASAVYGGSSAERRRLLHARLSDVVPSRRSGRATSRSRRPSRRRRSPPSSRRPARGRRREAHRRLRPSSMPAHAG